MKFKIEKVDYGNVGGCQRKFRATLLGVQCQHVVNNAYRQLINQDVYIETHGNLDKLKELCTDFASALGASAEFEEKD